jgi:hypothetical protein
VKKIKEWLQRVKEQKHVHSDELEKIILRCRTKYKYLFPHYDCRKKGSRSVHHFNVPGVPPISIERPHGGREYVPRTYIAYILEGLENLVAYIETNSKGESYDEHDNESDAAHDTEKDQSTVKGQVPKD